MKRVFKFLADHTVDLMLAAGAAAIAIGSGLIYLPAGLIVGGALVIAGAVLESWSGGESA